MEEELDFDLESTKIRLGEKTGGWNEIEDKGIVGGVWEAFASNGICWGWLCSTDGGEIWGDGTEMQNVGV